MSPVWSTLIWLSLACLVAGRHEVPHEPTGAGSEGYAVFGDSVSGPARISGAGDVNGDGVEDVVFGVGDESDPRLYVVFGRRDSVASINVDRMGDGGFTIAGSNQWPKTGGGAAVGAGDVNGDGFADVVWGASQSSAAAVVFGQANAASVSTSDLGARGFLIYASQGCLGQAVAGLGDLNGDGLDDVVLGAPGCASGERSGAFVVFGRTSTAVVDVSTLEQTGAGFAILGPADSTTGQTVGAAGDFNGDGLPDIIVGTSSSDSSPAELYVVFGKKTSAPVDVTALGVQGVRLWGASDKYLTPSNGCAVSGAGDVNGDGLADICIGAPGGRAACTCSGCSQSPGVTYVVFGSARAANISLANLGTAGGAESGFLICGTGSGAASGSAVSAAGDVNGDGLADVIVGSPAASNGAGQAAIVFGKRDGGTVNLNALGNSGFVLNGDTLSGVGGSVHNAGDVDGDGKPDVVVGAVDYGFVVFGKSTNTPLNLAALIGTDPSASPAAAAVSNSTSPSPSPSRTASVTRSLSSSPSPSASMSPTTSLSPSVSATSSAISASPSPTGASEPVDTPPPKGTPLWIVGVVVGALACAVAIFLFFFCRRRRAMRGPGLKRRGFTINDGDDDTPKSLRTQYVRSRPTSADEPRKSRQGMVTPPRSPNDWWYHDPLAGFGFTQALVEDVSWTPVKAGAGAMVADASTGGPVARALVRDVKTLFANGGAAGGTCAEFGVTRVDVILHERMRRSFNDRLTALDFRRGPNLVSASESDAEKVGAINRLKEHFLHPGREWANVLLAWHGCPHSMVDNIMSQGAGILRRPEGGHHGVGVYVSPQSQYAAGYLAATFPGGRPEPNARGEFAMVLFAAAIGIAYPITRGQDYPGDSPCSVFHSRGPTGKQPRSEKALKGGFDAHFVLVSEPDWEAARPGSVADFEELVLKEESQLLPLCVVYFKAQ